MEIDRIAFTLEVHRDSESDMLLPRVIRLLEAHLAALRATQGWDGSGAPPDGALELHANGEQEVPGMGRVLWDKR